MKPVLPKLVKAQAQIRGYLAAWTRHESSQLWAFSCAMGGGVFPKRPAALAASDARVVQHKVRRRASAGSWWSRPEVTSHQTIFVQNMWRNGTRAWGAGNKLSPNACTKVHCLLAVAPEAA